LGSRSFQGNQSGEAISFFDSIKIRKEENIIPASIPATAILTDGKNKLLITTCGLIELESLNI
jgi:hypothetical protein